MKSSCVRHPEKNSFLIIREWQIRFCDGDYCAAGLLSFFSYTHDWKLEQRQQAVEANNVAERHGDIRNQFEHLYQYYTYEDLNKRLLGLYSERAIPQSIKLLVNLGVLTCHKNPNPKYSFDKTTYYLFNPEVCNRWIEQNYCNGEFVEKTENEETRNTDSFSPVQSEENTYINKEDAVLELSKSNIASSNRQFLHDRESKNTRPLGNFATSSGNIATPINNNTILQKQTKNKTAAEGDGADFHSTMSNQKPSAAVSFNSSCLKDKDLLIGETLSECQIQYVLLTISKYAQKLNIPIEQLKEEVIYSLLSKEDFSASSNDFVRKLNTISKLLREERWTTPVGLKKSKDRVMQQKMNAFNVEKNSLICELKQLEDFLTHFKKEQNESQVHYFENEIQQVKQKIEQHQSSFSVFAHEG